MKKRLVSILLCLAMILTAFTGCGSSDPEEEARSKAAMEGGSTEGTEEKGATGAEGVFTYAIGGDTGNTLNPLTADDRWGLMTCLLVY